MKTPLLLKWKIAAGLAFTATLIFVSSASATLTTTADNTNNATAFTPAWPVATGAANLINGLQPTSSFGNFTQEAAGGLPKLTDGAIGPVTGTTIFATCGNNGGRMAIFDLPASANGYDITNITTFSGWGNGGRHAQAYTLYYSTKAAPRKFIQLGNVVYSGGFTANDPNNPSANRVQWVDTAGAPIAGNVAAIMFDFNNPTSPNGYNGYVGMSEITVQGTASVTAMPQVVAIAATNETSTLGATTPFTPDWTLASPSLIAGALPITTNGNFNLESPTALGSRDVGSLTLNGNQTLTKTTITANNNGTTSPNYVTCGGGGGAGTTLIWALTNSPVTGSDVTNIVVYNGWADNGRFGQYYTVSYSTVAAPATYIPISTIFYLPTVAGSQPTANRVTISSTNGVPLGSSVANVKFDFSSPPAAGAFNNGFQGYSQFVIQGNDTATPPPPPSPYMVQSTLPSHVETFAGDSAVFTVIYSNSPPANLQWLFVTNGVTNILSGQTSATLTLNNLQTNQSGLYLVKAVNATNGAAAPSYSAAASLTVSPVSAAVNGVIQNNTAQFGLGVGGISTNFYPTWTFDTNNDLILGATYSAVGAGAFGDGSTGTDPILLTDGDGGYINYWPNVGGSPTLVTCGNNKGQSVTYTLPASTYGYDITNITVYGGWGDGGRDELKYEVLYSVDGSAPSIHLITADINPAGVPPNIQSATRSMLTAPSANGLMRNVTAITFNFNVGPENGYCGYSEIVVKGQPSPPIPTIAQDISTVSAVTVAGDHLTLSATFNGADTYQWQKNGTNIANGPNVSGATTTTLVLSNLQTSDTATNGGYRLAGINSSGPAYSAPCALTVNPVSPATNNVVISVAGQIYLHHATYTPDWVIDTSANNLIYLMAPSASSGNFNLEPFATSRDVSELTDGGSLTVSLLDDGIHTTSSGNYVTCGNGVGLDGTQNPTNGAYLSSLSGAYVVYTLPANANGYNLTNITVYGAWADGGRDQQAYTVLYSTVVNPTVFLPLTTVNYNPPNPDGGSSVTRVTLTPGSGAMVANVAAVMLDFRSPGTENGYGGYAEITVGGSPTATTASGPIITTENQTNTFSWTLETPNLIANQQPSTNGPGVFTNEGCTEAGLTDGVLAFGGGVNSASCGADGTAVPYIVFTSPGGWNLTNIVVYSLWHDYGRDGQFYNLSYSTLSAPTTFIPLTTVYYNPDVPHDGRASGNRVAISPATGQTMLASNVAAVKFDFTVQGNQDFGWSGYTEIVLQGVNLAPPVVNPVTITGGNLIVTGTGAANSGYTVLTTTNLLTPLVNWTISATGVTDGAGVFSNAIPVNASQAGSFFRVRMP